MSKHRVYGFTNKVRRIKSGERLFKFGYKYFTADGFRVKIDKITTPQIGEKFVRISGWKNEITIETAKHPFHKPDKNWRNKKHHYLIVDDYVYSD